MSASLPRWSATLAALSGGESACPARNVQSAYLGGGQARPAGGRRAGASRRADSLPRAARGTYRAGPGEPEAGGRQPAARGTGPLPQPFPQRLTHRTQPPDPSQSPCDRAPKPVLPGPAVPPAPQGRRGHRADRPGRAARGWRGRCPGERFEECGGLHHAAWWAIGDGDGPGRGFGERAGDRDGPDHRQRRERRRLHVSQLGRRHCCGYECGSSRNNNDPIRASAMSLFSGVTPGQRTFTAMYRLTVQAA